MPVFVIKKRNITMKQVYLLMGFIIGVTFGIVMGKYNASVQYNKDLRCIADIKCPLSSLDTLNNN